jgi:PAS domain S-box-containing protein
MENARLITETREALEQQTATAEVLQVINSSPGDLAPVFDTILEKALELCGAAFGLLWTYDGERMHVAAMRGVPPAYAEFLTRGPHPVGANNAHGRLLRGEPMVHIADAGEDQAYHADAALRRATVELGGGRSLLAAPLRKDEAFLGAFVIYRQEVRPFSDRQVALLESFAAQAVIAIENARLLGELRHRTADLARSVDELTATGDVLKIISRSSTDLETVLDTLVETVARLCRADTAHMVRRRDDKYHAVASSGFSEEEWEFFRTHPASFDRGTVTGRVALERRAVHIPDVLQDPEYTYKEGQKLVGFRTALGIPLLRGDELIGIILVSRTRAEPFTDKEIALATTFADQAVIAIENARLFDELRERQAELRVTFDNMGDGVVMFDAEARLTAWNRNFQEMLELPDAFLAGRPSHADYFHYLADRGEYVSADLEEQLSRTVEDTRRELRFERTRPDGRVIEVRRNAVPDGGFVMIYSDITERKRAEAAISAARDAAEAALRELQTAQASLVHAQKMAALGQLTAGIAHEIKNPLNFVNNFAGLSVELLDELKEASAKAVRTLDADERAEITETIQMLTGNLEKIAEHGRRADGIVKSMLQHSRGGSGDWQATDLNALVEEALNLAYHGARAQDQSFNITMERDLDRNLLPIEVVPQDMMRVFLNLIGNGFYAANQRSGAGDGTFRPVLKVTTREVGDAVEIRVRDNGVGIPKEHREKLFQPFFTTKPTGEGTGLGLSISYDIVTQQHGGTITVESEVGDFTEFTVRLPRRQRPAAGRVA